MYARHHTAHTLRPLFILILILWMDLTFVRTFCLRDCELISLARSYAFVMVDKWPNKNSHFGIMDLMGFWKDCTHWCRLPFFN